MDKINRFFYKVFFTGVVCVFVWPQALQSQQTVIVQDEFQQYLQAKQWFQQENYQLAYPVFKQAELLAEQGTAKPNELRLNEILFYALACELMQGNNQAAEHAKQYLSENNSATMKGQLGYYLGMHYFYKNEYNQAISAFEQASVSNLNNRQVVELQFSQGYSYFTQKQLPKAKPLLYSVKSITDSKYYFDANYYYGLLAFNDKNYKEALAAFDVAKADLKYQGLVPYYSASINYTLGQKDKGLEQAELALKQGNQFYDTQLKQLVGHGYFEKGNYAKALPYLEQYVSASEKVKREDLYELGFCYYQQNQLPKAIEKFKPLSGGQDTLSQSAMYLLGDAYLKTNQKANARQAFLFCSTNSSNAAAKESATFLYGKLSYELGYDNEALPVLKSFATTYPKSKNINEANDLLVSVLSNTSNYKEALELYEMMPNKSVTTQKQYPNILFNRAQELINDRKLIQAEPLLDKALAAPYNKSIQPLAQFWKGELAYQKEQYAVAENFYKQYLANPISNAEVNPDNARYNLAYCLMQQGKYDAAQKELSNLSNSKFSSLQQSQDVALRLADTYYMQKSFGNAKPLYNKIIAANGVGADYATYQNGMIAGAQNNTTDKIANMRSIETIYPNSILVQPANMEIANTYLADEKFKDALPYLNKIISNKNNSSLKPEAYLKSGISYFNLDNNTEALNQFKALLKQYPQSAESDDAIDNVRSIFVEQGKPNEFVSFMNEIGRKVDVAQADSLTYSTAEMQLSDGKKDAALTSFVNYLNQYPSGRYVVPASYNAAEIFAGKKDFENALKYYTAVAEKAPNKYAEKSVLAAARINYFDIKNLDKAAVYYQQLKGMATSQNNKLEAMRGLLRCQFYTKQYQLAGDNAKELLEQRGAGNDDKIFANLVLGKNAQANKSYTEAITNYKAVTNLNNAEYGAEARYETANCLFLQNKYADAEKAAFDVIKKSGSYELWVTKSYILLGDVYYAQKDFFNAKATYKSVSENSGIKELKEEAQSKLLKVETDEQTQLKISG